MTFFCSSCRKHIEGKPARTGRRSFVGPHGAGLSNYEKSFCAPCVAEMDAMNERYRKEADEKTARDVAEILKKLGKA